MSEELSPTRLPDGEIRMMSQPERSSLLGKTVLFTPGVAEHERVNGASEYVAVIGQVFNDPGVEKPYCNLYVMPPFAAAYWEGSCQEGEGPRTFQLLSSS
jgi:hypothetical protein